MKASLARWVLPTILLAAISACSTQPSSTGNVAAEFSADFDGAHWASASNLITVNGTNGVVPGSVIITGVRLDGNSNTTSLTLSIGYITGTGTYPLGVNQLTTAGGTAQVQSTAPASVGAWNTGFSGAAGTITITSITSSQIVGTFQFTAPPQAGGLFSKVVTNGKFTVPLGGFAVAPSSNPGSLITATLSGSTFNAATVSGQGSGGSFGILGTLTTTTGATHTVSLTASGALVAGAVYPLAPPPGGGTYIAINITVGTLTFDGLGAGSSGSVTITSLSGGRVKGSFSGTLIGNGSALSVTDGTFDVKIN